MHFLGIDIGTSAVKAVLVDERQSVVGDAAAPLATSHPRPGWSEQDPEDWWRAVEIVVGSIRTAAPSAFRDIGAIGLSGQMHGAVLLDANHAVIRPAMLWNDGRAVEECAEFERNVPGLARIAGVTAMPGFTAPKLLWLKRHEPAAFARMRRILPAKDYVRLRLTGEFATDMSDAAGTLFLDEARRDWSAPMLAACGLGRDSLPRLLEGSAPSGVLRPALREAWGIERAAMVAAGAGDAAAGAIGLGAIDEGDSFVSLGTSAQFFVTRESYRPKPERLVHAFAHALPGRWFEMAALLNGASPLGWLARLLGEGDIDALVDRVAARFRGPSPLLFLPYLSGERTPLNDPEARGVFAGLDAASDSVDLVQAVLEGVAFSLVDARDALGWHGEGPLPVIGGGARNRFWLRLIASALGVPVGRVAGADKGPAFGAARLARLALTGEASADVCVKPPLTETIEPEPALHRAYGERIEAFRGLYRSLKARRRASSMIRFN
jgi:xylulokinase